MAAIGVKRPRLGLVPESAQYGRQLGHLVESVAFGFVSGVDDLGGTVADGLGARWSFVASAAAFESSGWACDSVAAGASGAVMPSASATRSPASVAPPTSGPDSRGSRSTAMVLAVSRNLQRGAPRGGQRCSPAP